MIERALSNAAKTVALANAIETMARSGLMLMLGACLIMITWQHIRPYKR